MGASLGKGRTGTDQAAISSYTPCSVGAHCVASVRLRAGPPAGVEVSQASIAVR